MLQAVPFHVSASVEELKFCNLLPTATQAEAEKQETADRAPSQPTGFGMGWRLQVVPFQRSAKVSWMPTLLV